MTKAKKTSKRDSLENILVEGEDVLWQGKPHASLLEYILEKPPKIVERRIKYVLLSLKISIAVMVATIILLILFSSLEPMFSDNNLVLFAFLLPIQIGMGITVFFWCVVLYLTFFPLIRDFITGIIEKPFVRYAITNERIIIITNQWFYDFLHHFAVRGVVIEDGQHGATVSWLGVSEDETPIDRFLGLSEFDVTHLIEIVKSRSSLVVEIEDKREGKASA